MEFDKRSRHSIHGPKPECLHDILRHKHSLSTTLHKTQHLLLVRTMPRRVARTKMGDEEREGP